MISIIIPVFNEEVAIERTLRSLPYGQGIEVIVVDGGSFDQTVQVAKRYLVTVITSQRGRAIQMNAGAAQASGKILLFLHGDCVLDAEGFQLLRQDLPKTIVGGCFQHRIDSKKMIYRLIEISGNLRAKIFRIFYGDQAIFVCRDIFKQMNGFDNVPIFEDAIVSKRLRHYGQTIVLKANAIVLPRRWEKGGVFKTTLLNWLLTVGFLLGVSTSRLAKLYKDIR